MRSTFFALLLCSITALQAQTIIPEDALSYWSRMDLEEAAAADPDSVFALRIYGSSILEEELPENYISENIFRYRNLQALEIIGTHAQQILDRINEFPLLQYLELNEVAMDDLPPAFYELANMHVLKLDLFEGLNFDTLSLLDNQIHELSLSNCTSIHPEDAENYGHPVGLFPELRKLAIHGNEYQVHPSLFELSYLEELDVSNSRISNLDGIENLLSLKMLNVSQNKDLEELPYYIGDLENLEVLWADEVPLLELPETLPWLTKLRDLSISGNSVSYLPENFGDMTALERVYINESDLSELPESFGNLESLESLNLSGNKFKTIPTVIFGLSNLRYLTIDRNELSGIPAGLNNLANLVHLSMESNHFSNFESGILQMPNLQFLDLTYCNIGKMPPLAGLTNLHDLEMEWCGIKEIDPSLFSLAHLYSLNLEGNEITALPAKGWKGLGTLSTLQLQQNKITALPKDFSGMAALNYLDLSHNQLKALPKGFSKLRALSTLDLYENKGVKFPKEMKKMNLERLILKGGDLNDKSLASLKKWVGNDVVQISDY